MVNANVSLVGTVVVSLCTFVATVMTMALTVQHLRRLTEPKIQRYIMRVIWMVPVYCVTALMEFQFPATTLWWRTVRSFYEGFVLYQFFNLLVEYLGGTATAVQLLESHEAPQRHIPPLCWLPPYRLGARFFFRVKRGVVQFVLVKPLVAVFELVAAEEDLFGSYNTIVVLFCDNLTIVVSLYCLTVFYFATKKELAPFNPLSKFLCIKAVLFFSYWQGLAIALLVYLKVIPPEPEAQGMHNRAAIQIQAFLVIVEMVVAGAAHMHAFSYEDLYLTTQGATIQGTFMGAVQDAILPTDVVEDTVQTLHGRARASNRREDGSDGAGMHLLGHLDDSESDEGPPTPPPAAEHVGAARLQQLFGATF